jgi:hypothetical protein
MIESFTGKQRREPRAGERVAECSLQEFRVAPGESGSAADGTAGNGN